MMFNPFLPFLPQQTQSAPLFSAPFQPTPFSRTPFSPTPFSPALAMSGWLNLARSMTETSMMMTRSFTDTMTAPDHAAKAAPMRSPTVIRSSDRRPAQSNAFSATNGMFDPFGLLEMTRRMLEMGAPARAGAANPFYPVAAAFPFAVGHPAKVAAAVGASALTGAGFPKLFFGYQPANPMTFGTPFDGWGMLTFGFAVPPTLAKMAGNPGPLWLAA